MRDLTADIAHLKELRARNVASVAEVFATIGSRSGSPGVVDYGTGKSATTDQALRKLQEKDPDFPSMMASRSTFYRGLWRSRSARS